MFLDRLLPAVLFNPGAENISKIFNKKILTNIFLRLSWIIKANQINKTNLNYLLLELQFGRYTTGEY